MNLKSLLLALSLTLLLTACGGETTVKHNSSLATTSLLNTNNYVTIAKTLYAQQTGEQIKTSFISKTLKAPNASRKKDTLYINKVVKPRGYRVEKLEVLYNDNKLTIDVDSSFKYATITYGENSTKVNFKEFTTN